MCYRTTMAGFPSEFVLFDLEYTAWEGSRERGWSGPGEHREIIQIGAIRVSAETLSEEGSFLEYVRPAVNPKLSELIIELTGITQHDVDTRGVSFMTAFDKFKAFAGDTYAYCWGNDIEVLEENTTLAGTEIQVRGSQFRNIRPLMAKAFSDAGVDIIRYSSGTLIEAFRGSSGRRAHDALNDMRNLLEALCELSKRTDLTKIDIT